MQFWVTQCPGSPVCPEELEGMSSEEQLRTSFLQLREKEAEE